MLKNKSKLKKILLFCASALIIAIVITGIILHKEVKNLEKQVVLESLTGDWLGPVSFNDNIYFPSQEKINALDYTKSLGIAEKITILGIIFGMNHVYGDENDKEYVKINIHGVDDMDYIRADVIESKEFDFSLYKEYILDSAFVTNKKVLLTEEFVRKLEEVFGTVVYDQNDFENYKEYYSVFAYQNENKDNTAVIPRYIGCILKINDTYYYGNSSNEITGTLLSEFYAAIE